jgi:peptide-methionine (S)-S-oxide reductase
MNAVLRWMAAITLAAVTYAPAAAQGTVDVALTRVAHATFAGGCFWCMEKPFDKLDGVLSTTSGYAGGPVEAPDLRAGVADAPATPKSSRSRYDPDKVSYDEAARGVLAQRRSVRGEPPVLRCRPAVPQRDLHPRRRPADGGRSLAAGDRRALPRPAIATQLQPLAGTFFPAEDYHQDYYLKNPIRYRYYRNGCGRDRRLEAIWGKPE